MVTDKTYFKAGKRHVKIKNMKNLHHNFAREAYQALLQDLVKDKELISILATEQNMTKFKHRLQIDAELIGEGGEVLATMEKYNTTLLQASQDIPMGNLKVDSEYDSLSRYFYQLGWINYTHKKNGEATTVKGTLTFRKGR